VELVITPEPDEDEREAIAAALAPRPELPELYASAWRREALGEAVEPPEAT
jgi:hypothetical protein